ncbi:hypothetical protein NQ317_005209, partial [Molorchus minor]
MPQISKVNQDVKRQDKKGTVGGEQLLGTPSVLSATNKSTASRSRYRSIYAELLDRLRKEFYKRWDSKSISSNTGLDDLIPLKTLGTGSFGRVKSHHEIYTELLDKMKEEYLQRWETTYISSNNGIQEFVRVKTVGLGAFGNVLLVRRKEKGGDAYYAMKVIDKTSLTVIK